MTRDEAALDLLLRRLARAQAEFDLAMTPEERALAEACQCGLCEGLRQLRQALADYEKARKAGN